MRNEEFYRDRLLKNPPEPFDVALVEFPVGKARTDVVLMGKECAVYEIKTEFDTLRRLGSQVENYSQVFSNINLVIAEIHLEKAIKVLEGTNVGIYVLTDGDVLALEKKSLLDNSKLRHSTIFSVLQKKEHEDILKGYYGALPNAPQCFQYRACLEMFSGMPILEAQALAMEALKTRYRGKWLFPKRK